jgi:hypothetical protein
MLLVRRMLGIGIGIEAEAVGIGIPASCTVAFLTYLPPF